MDSPKPLTNPEDQRKYVRLKTVVAVDFTIVRLQEDLLGIDWEKGSVSNISRGGLCLETDSLNESIIKFLKKENVLLDLRLHVPFLPKSIKAVADVAWYKENSKHSSKKYVIGLEFQSIAPENLKILLAHANIFKPSVQIILVSVLLVVLFLIFTFVM